MPTRLGVGAIILFWLATLGWWVSRDLWPRWSATAGPPFAADLADEAVPQVARWVILRDGKPAGKQSTRIAYRDDDLFEMESTVTDLRLQLLVPFGGDFEAKVLHWKSVARYSRQGELRSLDAELRMTLGAPGGQLDAEASLSGTATGGVFSPRGRLRFSGQDYSPEFRPVPLTSKASLNPLQPVARIPGLTPGRSWEVSLVDPLSEVFRAATNQVIAGLLPKGLNLSGPESAPERVLAVVSDEPQTITVQGKEASCHVIEYRSDKVKARTFVRVSDGKVMRQEAGQGSELLTLERVD